MSDPETPSVTDPNDPNDGEPPEVPLYTSLELVDDELVVYDVGNHRAWVQSDSYVDLAACV